MMPRRLTGRCWNGAERDSGHVYHAVSPENAAYGKALCGAQPGLRSNGWAELLGPAVTCPKCAQKMARLQSRST